MSESVGEIAKRFSMNQKAGSATVGADYRQTEQPPETDKSLYDLGVILGLAYKSSKNKVDELATRNDIAGKRLGVNHQAIQSQLAEQQAGVDQICPLAVLKQKQLETLKVHAAWKECS